MPSLLCCNVLFKRCLVSEKAIFRGCYELKEVLGYCCKAPYCDVRWSQRKLRWREAWYVMLCLRRFLQDSVIIKIIVLTYVVRMSKKLLYKECRRASRERYAKYDVDNLASEEEKPENPEKGNYCHVITYITTRG